MRKLGIAIGALAIAAFLASAVSAQSAPTPPSAATVLSNVQQYYANATQLSALFRQTVTNATFGSTKISDGQLWVLKPTYFRFDYMTKQQKTLVTTKAFVFDGTSLWLIDHNNKRITQVQPQSSVLPAAVSFLTGASALSSQFTIVLNTSGSYGGKGDFVLELTPNQPSAQYQQLFFVVDPSNWRVKVSIVIDANGNMNRFNFYTPNLNATVKKSYFQVNPTSLPTYKLVQLQTTPASSSGSAPASGPTSGSGSAIP